MPTKTNTDNIDDRQAEIDDIKKQLDTVREALDAAESCETPADFDSNVEEALSLLASVRASLKEVRR